MNNLSVVILGIIFIATSSVYAAAGKPVHHKHGERSHSHPLPTTGVNHSHNKGPSKKKSPTKYTPRPGWFYITESDKSVYEGKNGTFEIVNTKGGKRVASLLTEIRGINGNNKVSHYERYVPVTDCRKGYGTVVALGLDGAYVFESDWVADGSNVASGLADEICSLLKYVESKEI